MGNPPVPNELKKLRGNPGKRAIPEDSAESEPGEAQAPEWLDGDELRYFYEYRARLNGIGVATASYQSLLVGAALKTIEVRDLTLKLRALSSTTMIVETQFGASRKTAPEFTQRSTALMELMRILSELGLTPTAVTKVRTVKKKSADLASILKPRAA